MDLGGLSMENFPPVAGNDTKTLRKLSLLEARMVGAGNESRDASLPPNDGSRGSENNSSNSMSTIGFPKPRYVVASPDGGSQSNARRRTPGVGGQGLEQAEPDGGGKGSGKRKAPADGIASPYRPAFPSHSSGTSDTQSTSPGESRDLNATYTYGHRGEDGSGSKRARAGGIPLHPQSQQLPSRPPAPQHDRDRQTPQGADYSAPGILRAPQGQAQGQGQGQGRRTSRVSDGGASPSCVPPTGKPAGGCDGVVQSPAALTPGIGPESSPQSGARGGKSGAAGYIAGGGHGGPAGVTKTIQSYFLKPSNGLAVQALAASYAGEPEAMVNEGGGSPKEVVYLSGADDESLQGAERIQRRAAGKVDKISPTARASLAEGVSLHQGFLNVASGDQSGGQAQGQGQKALFARGQGGSDVGSSRRGQDEKVKVQTNPGHVPQVTPEAMENALGRLKEAENLAKRLQKDLDRANLERSGMESMLTTLQTQLDSKINELKTHEEERQKHRKQLTSVIESLLRKVSAQEASDCRAKLARDSLQLGKIVSVKTGHIGKYVEAFEEGSFFKDVETKLAALASTRSKLEGRKRAVAKLLKASTPAAAEGQPDEAASQEVVQARLEAVEEEETVRMHLAGLRREEIALQDEKRSLDGRKVVHIRELKRVAHEDRSKFANRPTLNGRYVLLNLLGKGGFSEVWRAFDLVHARDVAVKVHQLLNNWNESQKANFIRHVTREYEIHQQMRHPRIVNLTDVFEICCDSFATVLDYCRGTDLECVLRERKQVPERDARALILQVARGLQYLNTAQEGERERRGAIIHYDLKPGNILLDENGDVKITDFGLSKILEIRKDTEKGTGGGTSMELTSKGAGTYWYLPPECFGENPRISSKVDVWSLGVVFYQMLYGVRPFGEGLSQEKILREKVIVKANRVDFPPKPSVSEEAKSFIRSCLTYTDATRPDVHAMCKLPYLSTPLPKRGTS